MPEKIPVMKAKNSNEERLATFSFPAYSQMKADGMRFQVEIGDHLFKPLSSVGRTYPGLHKLYSSDIEKIKNEFRSGYQFVLDGELLAHDNLGKPLPRAKSNGITNKLGHNTITQEELGSLKFMVWDLIPSDEFWSGKHLIPYHVRLQVLTRIIAEQDLTFISLIPTVEVADIESAKQHARELIAMGYEGTILKEIDSPWENKRSKHCLKFKEEHDCDLEVVEIQEGQGKYVGMMGALICESADKKVRVKIGTGFSDALRNKYFFEDQIMGKIVRVEYNTKTEAQNGVHSLFLPKFGELREDKFEADSIDQIQ
tara:strand:+ start:158 stop:1096 length:939 start_codon:yes stop_codon:yes gene_type:complete